MLTIAKSVFCELQELSGAGRCGQQIALVEGCVEGLPNFFASGSQATDHPVVTDQLQQDADRQHPLGAVGHVDLLRHEAGDISEHHSHLDGCAQRRGGFQKYEIAWTKHGCNRSGYRQHLTNVGLRKAVRPTGEGGGNGDQKHIGHLRCQLGSECSKGKCSQHGLIEIRLQDVDPALVVGGNDFDVDIHADHPMARTSQHRHPDKANEAEAKDKDPAVAKNFITSKASLRIKETCRRASVNSSSFVNIKKG